MRRLVRTILVNCVALYLLTVAIPAIQVQGGLETFVIAALTLAVLNTIVRPVVNLLLLPVNLLTLGMFRWVASSVVLWMLSIFVRQFQITTFHFQGFSSQGFTIPQMTLSVFWTTVVGAFMFSWFISIVDWATET